MPLQTNVHWQHKFCGNSEIECGSQVAAIQHLRIFFMEDRVNAYNPQTLDQLKDNIRDGKLPKNKRNSTQKN